MKYLFGNGFMNSDGSFTIDPEHVERWITQMNLPYEMLSEKEKDSDRIEADKYLKKLLASEVCKLKGVKIDDK